MVQLVLASCFGVPVEYRAFEIDVNAEDAISCEPLIDPGVQDQLPLERQVCQLEQCHHQFIYENIKGWIDTCLNVNHNDASCPVCRRVIVGINVRDKHPIVSREDAISMIDGIVLKIRICFNSLPLFVKKLLKVTTIALKILTIGVLTIGVFTAIFSFGATLAGLFPLLDSQFFGFCIFYISFFGSLFASYCLWNYITRLQNRVMIWQA